MIHRLSDSIVIETISSKTLSRESSLSPILCFESSDLHSLPCLKKRWFDKGEMISRSSDGPAGISRHGIGMPGLGGEFVEILAR